MTGPKHYRRAEHFLAIVANMSPTTYDLQAPIAIARAQAHATLALAAATAHSATLPADGKTADAWRDTIAVPRPTIVNHP